MRDYLTSLGFTPVILESPYAGEITENVSYARRAILDCLKKYEAPFASHLLYPEVLRDHDEMEREHGMAAGWAWVPRAARCVVYTDRGISTGMHRGIAVAKEAGIPIVYRSLK